MTRAAGFLDPITGEGMASALLQARAAARVIDAALASAAATDLSPYAAEHRLITTTGDRLTRIALLLANSNVLTRRAMRGLRRRRGLFEKLLAVNSGRADLGSLSPRDWLALTTGF
jgi:flavin-dependent dehydrogenase